MKLLDTGRIACLFLLCVPALHANIIGFDEKFALAEDRSIPLKELIPGTEEYYYYHCLHYQHIGEFKKVDETLTAWIKRYRHTGQVNEILDRQALLEYETNPAKSLKRIRERLNLHFSHTREDLSRKPVYKTALDQNLTTLGYLMKDAMSHYRNLDGLEDMGLEYLESATLNPDRRRHYLQRLKRPDYPGLVDLIIADLKYKHSGGFGSHKIHTELLLSQLDELLIKQPALRENEKFIHAYMRKLRPHADVNAEFEPELKQAQFEAMWAFAKTLAPAYNSIKAHVLYNWLDDEMSRGVYDKTRFLEYLSLPRRSSHVNPAYVKNIRDGRHFVNLSGDYKQFTRMSTVRTDDKLVRRFLLELLKEGDTRPDFSRFIRSEYLKELYAETKIISGIGDMESWYSLLSPSRYKALLERIDLDLLPTNPEIFRPGDEVALDVGIKNVKTLFVKTYRINTQTWYRDRLTPVTTDIDLDGLVANDERTITYKEVPLRRHDERLAFPEIKESGVYVVEMIGNGKSSRSVLRVGELRFAERLSSAGHVFHVFDHDNKPLSAVNLWLAGTTYRPDESGDIIVPFSNKPGKQHFVLSHKGFSALHKFTHQGEGYSLASGFHIEREQLLSRKEATVVVRPELRLNGLTVSVELLENPYLMIHTADIEGIRNSKRVDDVKLIDGKEYAYTFAVPANLQHIQFSLHAKVRNLSQGSDQDLSSSSALSVNQIDKTANIMDVHLRGTAKGYVVEVLGRSGEAREGFPLQVEFKHHGFKRVVHSNLQTDASGRANLGPMTGMQWVRVKAGSANKLWNFHNDRRTYDPAVHALAGLTVQVPYMSGAPEKTADLVSLLEVRDGTYVRDVRSAVKVTQGMMLIEGLEPGDYSLHLKKINRTIPVRITRGDRIGNTLVSRYRMLETRNLNPMTIASVQPGKDGKSLSVQILNPGEQARVHVIATRYKPVQDVYDALSLSGQPGWRTTRLNPRISQYLAGRKIGDEYRYVLERRYVDKYAGNMLARPTLLLNPWSLRKTDAGVHDASEGEAWDNEEMAAEARYGGRAPAQRGGGAGGLSDTANLDFLPSQSVILRDLKINEDGSVSVPVKRLGANQFVQVLAIDRYNTASRYVAFPIRDEDYKDLRQNTPLDPAGHFTEQKHISVVKGGALFTIEDITTSKMEVYDTLPRVFQLYSTLSGNATLSEFSFISTWPDLDEKEKRRLYSKYACHELHYFLFKKDPEFFKKVIKPYLANKKDKTFMDDWLLGRDLAMYAKPWKYARLNIAERVLLGQKVAGEKKAAARHIKDRFDLLPPDLEAFNRLFDTAIKGSALATSSGKDISMASMDGLRYKMKTEGVYASSELKSMKKASGFSSGDPFSESEDSDDAFAVKEMASMDRLEKAPESAMKLSAPSVSSNRKMKDMLMLDGKKQRSRRAKARQFYRKLDKTEEWVENNYYHIPIEQQIASLVDVNAFWRDRAAEGEPFFSSNLAEAHGNFTEMMFALASLDLPFEAGKHELKTEDVALKFKPAGAAVVYHREIRKAEANDDPRPILVSQNFFAQNDRYRHENNERFDRFVVDAFEARRVYGCQVVLTNPTSSRRKVDVLLQIPEGSLPVQSGFYTKSRHVQVEPYSTMKVEYYFYFPMADTYVHYPVHVAQDEKVLASAEAFTFKVLDKLDDVDKSDWPWISQHGSAEAVVAYLNTHNIDRIDVGRIAFRMKDKVYFEKVMDLLDKRHVYNNTLWSYGVHHNVVPVIREFLQHSSYANQVGVYIDSPLLSVDPVIRHRYQHKEYWPLVNPRQHRLGKDNRILNAQFFGQYNQWLAYLRYRPVMNNKDRVAATYYLVLQDRITEALSQYGKIKDVRSLETRIQADYFDAYLAFSQEEPERAGKIAKRYEKYPVDRWQKRFANVLSQVEEITGGAAAVSDTDDRSQTQGALVDSAPSLDIGVENRELTIRYQNLANCKIRYYLMDIELLFSRNPFVQDVSGQFSIIEPNMAEEVKLGRGKGEQVQKLPAKYRDRNMMIEVEGEGITRSEAYYPHSLNIQMIENYGQVRVTHAKTGKPLAKTYVKVYSRSRNGQVKFFKDGYTDLRGRFDYTSLNTNEIEGVESFSLLILDEEHGAVVRQAKPPKM